MKIASLKRIVMGCMQLGIISQLGATVIAPWQSAYYVSFDDSMNLVEESSASRFKKNYYGHIISLCRELYERNHPFNKHISERPIIPKIVHLIWVGPRTPPEVFTYCQESIKKYLPGWECNIWRDEDISTLNMINKAAYERETNYGAKSDILRYELLYRFGGVYMDVDFIVCQPLDILNHMYEFYACCFPWTLPDTIGNSMIASIPGHPIMEECFRLINGERSPQASVLERTGPFMFQEAVYNTLKKRKNNNDIIFPKSFFYPFDPSLLGDDIETINDLERFNKPETFAAHYWAKSWCH